MLVDFGILPSLALAWPSLQTLQDEGRLVFPLDLDTDSVIHGDVVDIVGRGVRPVEIDGDMGVKPYGRVLTL